jgi:hypothetical protein
MGSDLVASTTKAALVMWVKAGLHVCTEAARGSAVKAWVTGGFRAKAHWGRV